MELTVPERLILLNLLPKQGDITTIRIIRDLQADLSFSEEEHKALQFVQDGSRVTWTPNGVGAVNIKIGPKASRLIAEVLESLSQEGKLGLEHLSLYERFCEEEASSSHTKVVSADRMRARKNREDKHAEMSAAIP